jgi:hypothetical protein
LDASIFGRAARDGEARESGETERHEKVAELAPCRASEGRPHRQECTAAAR